MYPAFLFETANYEEEASEGRKYEEEASKGRHVYGAFGLRSTDMEDALTPLPPSRCRGL